MFQGLGGLPGQAESRSSTLQSLRGSFFFLVRFGGPGSQEAERAVGRCAVERFGASEFMVAL